MLLAIALMGFGEVAAQNRPLPPGLPVPKEVDPERATKLDEITSSTVYAELVRAVDADTVEVYAYPWPRFVLRAEIDLIGIDGPDIAAAQCERELKLGQRAKAFIEGLRIDKMELYGMRYDDEGRLQGFALVRLVGSTEDLFLSSLLEENGYARSWLKGRKPDWCKGQR